MSVGYICKEKSDFFYLALNYKERKAVKLVKLAWTPWALQSCEVYLFTKSHKFQIGKK